MSAYYYADGKRIALDLEPSYVAIDVRRVRSKALAAELAAPRPGIPRLPGVQVLARRAALSDADLRALTSDGALLTVYRHGSTLVIPLPEVRIEVDDSAARRRVHRALTTSKIAHEVVEDDEERVVVRISSNRSEHALELANYVFKNAKPAASAPRLLQIIERRQPP